MTAFVVPITRDVITAIGKDARSFLHSQLSNDIAALAVGAVTHAFVLEPTGKVSGLFRVQCVADDRFVLDVDDGHGAVSLARLNKFKIRVQCDFSLSSAQVSAVRGLNPQEHAALGVQPGVVPAWRSDSGAADVFDNPTAAAQFASGIAAQYHAERVRCAWPLFGVDFNEASLPAETGLIDIAVSFTKGCYPGQELVERMDSRGSQAPQRLMRLPAAPSPGAPRAVAGEIYRTSTAELGMCTSVAGEFALVAVRRARVSDAEALLAN